MNNCQQFPMFEPEMVNKLQTYEVFRCFEAITSQIFAEKANVRGDAPTQLHTGQINDPYYPCSGQPPGLLLGSSTLMVPSHFNEEPLQAPVSVRSRSLSLSLSLYGESVVGWSNGLRVAFAERVQGAEASHRRPQQRQLEWNGRAGGDDGVAV